MHPAEISLHWVKITRSIAVILATHISLGSISKTDAMSFQEWARDCWDLPLLDGFLNATPTAELLPLSAGVQSDEEEMGLSYRELGEFGMLRKVEKLGPWSTYLRLLGTWKVRPGHGPKAISEKVMRFFRFYGEHLNLASLIKVTATNMLH